MKSKEQNQPVSDFPDGLSAPALRALANAGIERLDQLTKMSEAEVKKLHGIGPNAMGKLQSAMAAKGLAFAEGKTRKS